MKQFYSSQFLEVYEGDSLGAVEVVPEASCQLIILTPLGKKNLKQHYLKTAYADFTAAWVVVCDQLLAEGGNICVACLPKEKDAIVAALAKPGYSLAEEFILDMTKMPKMAEIAKSYKHTTDLYLIFNKTGEKTGIDVAKVEYPKDLLRKIIKKATKEGDFVLHLFSNTAKPAALAEETLIKCIVITDSAYWAQVAVDRATDAGKDRIWSKDLM